MKRRQFIIGLTSGLALFATGISLYKRNLVQEKPKHFIDYTNQEVHQLDNYIMPIALSSLVSMLYFWDNIYLILGFILLSITWLFY